MSVRNNKNSIAGEIYFITFTISDWQNIFTNDTYCGLVYKWFDYIKDHYANKIHGYVIMPNHLHVLIKITEKSPILPVLIMNAKRFMAYGIIELLKKDDLQVMLDGFKFKARIKDKAQYKVFNDRYDSLILQTEKFFLQKLNYTHNNPCQEKWRLVNQPEDYKYSSAANYILGKGYYEVDIINL